jgi:AraC-like DNA-binding protein
MLVRSYRTVSPLPPRTVAVCFLWHYPASHLGLPLATTLLCEVRTFLGSYHYDPRPPGQLVRYINVLLGGPIPRARHTGPMPQVPPARYLLRAKDLVDARYAEPITVDDLAAAAGLSRAHFSRMFSRTFGESPRSYLQTRRLERAAALLRYTDRSVADICVMVGLASVGSFTTSFARVYGMPPAAYRASLPPASIYARVPSCILRRDTRPPADSRVKTAHGEKTGNDRRP